jgi:hypothetical protein
VQLSQTYDFIIVGESEGKIIRMDCTVRCKNQSYTDMPHCLDLFYAFLIPTINCL